MLIDVLCFGLGILAKVGYDRYRAARPAVIGDYQAPPAA